MSWFFLLNQQHTAQQLINKSNKDWNGVNKSYTNSFCKKFL